MAIITGNKIPIYSQIAQTIKQRVRTGVYKPGDSLPSVRTIGKEFGVSVRAVHQAVHTLEENGIVQTHPGKGMIVVKEGDSERAAIIFGFIHPYISSMSFQRDVLEYVDEAFAERQNFVVVRSSRDDPVLEREIAQHLIANGARGLIVWPTNDDPNGEYFLNLSRKIPVVFVDRTLLKVDMPTVLLDYYACGREISHILLGKMQKKRMLILRDNLQISSYQNIVEGMDTAARELERIKDVTVVQLPITSVIQKFSRSDFSEIGYFEDYLGRLIQEGGYDAAFCTQDEFIDYCFAQTGLMERFPALQWATLRMTSPNTRSINYTRLKCLEWFSNSGEMISQAADLVQRWVLSRQMPTDVIRLKLRLNPS